MRSEVAAVVVHRVLRKQDYARRCDFFGEKGAVFLACGDVCFLAADPLEGDVEQEVAAKNAKPEEPPMSATGD